MYQVYLVYYRVEKKKTSAVRSKISSKLIFASCVGYFDRAYYGFYAVWFYVTSRLEGNKI